MKRNKQKIESMDVQAYVLTIIIGLQILYSGYMILKALLAILGLDIKLLGSPIILFSFGTWALVMYAGISFFRGKVHGWYGVTSVFFILLIKNILIIVSMITVLLFKESFLKDIHLPAIKLNPNVIWTVVEFVLSALMVKFLFSTDTINSFSFKSNLKRFIIIKLLLVVITVIGIYLGIGFLLL